MDLEPLLTELRFLANKPAQSLSNLISHFSKDCELPIRIYDVSQGITGIVLNVFIADTG